MYHFMQEEIKQFEEIIRSTAHLIIEFFQVGGSECLKSLEWENIGFIFGRMRTRLLNQFTYILRKESLLKM